MASSNDAKLDPDRHMKRLQKVFGVSKRIKEFTDLRVQSSANAEEKTKAAEALEEARTKRRHRISSLEVIHSNILEIVADMLDISIEQAQDGMADSDEHIQLIKSLTAAKGRKAVIFTWDLFEHPPKGEPITHDL